MLFPESNHRVRSKQKQDDEEIEPMPHNARQDNSRLDHPWDGTPEIAEELQELICLFYRDLVRPVLGQPLLSLGLAEAGRRRSQLFLELRHGKRLQIILDFGLGLNLGFGLGSRRRRRLLCFRFHDDFPSVFLLTPPALSTRRL